MTTKQKKLDWRIAAIAIVALAVIEVYALSKGIDGTLMTIVVAAIAGIGGYLLPSPLKLK